MKKGKIEKFSLRAIVEAVKREGSPAANQKFAFALGSRLDVSGKIGKVVKRDEQFKLVIEPDSVSGFIVFADCRAIAEMLRNVKVRKGSKVSISGRLVSFGARAACLTDCRLA